MNGFKSYMGGKYDLSANSRMTAATLDQTVTDYVQPINSEGIYTSKVVLTFVESLERKVREDVKLGKTDVIGQAVDKKYGVN
jgi:hypothetical protein